MTKIFESENCETEPWTTRKIFIRRPESAFIFQDQQSIFFGQAPSTSHLDEK